MYIKVCTRPHPNTVYAKLIKSQALELIVMSSMRIAQKTKKRLVKVKGKLESKDGERRSLEDTINELIDFFEEMQQENKQLLEKEKDT